jgi:hypothetical protein
LAHSILRFPASARERSFTCPFTFVAVSTRYSFGVSAG